MVCQLFLLLFFMWKDAYCVPSSNDYSPDYSEPGVPTEDCVCVPFYLCVEGEIVSDGSNIIDPRKKPQQDELPLDETYTPPECGPFHVCCRNPETSTVQPYEHRCGSRNPAGVDGRIANTHINGEAHFGEWPWQAVVLKKEGDDFIFKCGGTLIDEQHVLTVAHCADKLVEAVEEIVVRLGEWDTQNTDEPLQHEDYHVSQVIVHPQYRPNNLFNDLAIIRLAGNVTFKPHIDTACLPRDDDDFAGQDCVVTGWGTNAYKSNVYSVVMKEVSLPVVEPSQCQAMLRKTRLGKYFKLHGSFMCAGGQAGQDACKGDGGGPLVCFRPDNSYTVAGLVAWGIDCGQDGVPGVYVNVKKFINWISANTGKDISEYWSSP